MMATCVEPKNVAVFTCTIELCIDCNHASFLYICKLEFVSCQASGGK